MKAGSKKGGNSQTSTSDEHSIKYPESKTDSQ